MSKLEDFTRLSPDVDDWIAANAASTPGQSPENFKQFEDNPDLSAIRAVNARQNGHNAWSDGFPSSLSYPNGVTREDVAALPHDRMLRLQARLAALSTAEVTTEMLEETLNVPVQAPNEVHPDSPLEP